MFILCIEPVDMTYMYIYALSVCRGTHVHVQYNVQYLQQHIRC